MRAILQMEETKQDWPNSAIVASNLSETELLFGEIAAAVTTAEISVAYADNSANPVLMLTLRTAQADALHAAGEWEKAKYLFADAERRHRERQRKRFYLYNKPGYRYCDLLLSEGRARAARDRAALTLGPAYRYGTKLDIALDTLTLGRAHLALALMSLASERSVNSASTDVGAAAACLDETVEGLRSSGKNDDLPRGLLARAAFRRAIGDADAAGLDLDEVEEIAEPGPMRLFLCDCALERARVALARLEAFAPLNGFVEFSPPPPALPYAAAAARLSDEARKELDAARELIAECGYHRRDDELAELDDVVAGRRRFADLPPRV